MSPHPDPIGESEPTTVVVHDPGQLRYWIQRFATTETRLRLALREVGRDSEMVQLYLSRQSWP